MNANLVVPAPYYERCTSYIFPLFTLNKRQEVLYYWGYLRPYNANILLHINNVKYTLHYECV